jgi:hypothetical protein
MKYILCFLFCILTISGLAFGQNLNYKKNSENVHINYSNEKLINKINEFEKKLQSVKDTVNSYTNTFNSQIESNYEKRLNLSATVIQNQDSFINRILWVFSILIGILAIFFTLISYFVIIKPSKELIEDTKKLKDDLQTNLKNEISVKLSELLNEQRANQIEEYLNNIMSNESYLRTNSFSFFAVNQQIKLTNEQINKIYTFLLSNESNDYKMEKGMLESLLSKQEHKNVEKYFRDALEKGLDQNESFINILKYFQFSGFENYLRLLVKAILSSSSPYKSYSLALTLLSQDKFSCNLVVNDQELNDKMEITDLISIFNLWGQMIKITDSYLYEKIKGYLFTCPCCGYKIFTEKPEIAIEQCRICKWKHYSEFDDPIFKIKTCNNGVSLKEAQENFNKIGVSFREALNHNLAKKENYEKDENFKRVE